jgi:hypothetical protein
MVFNAQTAQRGSNPHIAGCFPESLIDAALSHADTTNWHTNRNYAEGMLGSYW